MSKTTKELVAAILGGFLCAWTILSKGILLYRPTTTELYLSALAVGLLYGFAVLISGEVSEILNGTSTEIARPKKAFGLGASLAFTICAAIQLWRGGVPFQNVSTAGLVCSVTGLIVALCGLNCFTFRSLVRIFSESLANVIWHVVDLLNCDFERSQYQSHRRWR